MFIVNIYKKRLKSKKIDRKNLNASYNSICVVTALPISFLNKTLYMYYCLFLQPVHCSHVDPYIVFFLHLKIIQITEATQTQ